MVGGCKDFDVETIPGGATVGSPYTKSYGYKPRAMFAMGAATAAADLGVWQQNAFAGFGWCSQGVRQTSVGSGGYEAGNVSGGCYISASLYAGLFEATNNRALLIDVESIHCPNPVNNVAGVTWINAVEYSTQVMGLLAMGGTQLQVSQGEFNWPTSAGDVSVSGVGFEPQVVMFLWSKQRTYNQAYAVPFPGATSGTGFGFGAASSADPDEQFAHYCSSIYFGPHYGYAAHMTGKVIQHVGNTSLLASATLASMDPDGFTLTFDGPDTGELSSQDQRLIGWIAMRDVQGGFHVGTDVAETSTGLQSYSGCGFEPDCVVLTHGNVPSANTWYDGRGSFGIGMFDDTLELAYVNGEALGPATGNVSARYMDDQLCMVAAKDNSATVTVAATRDSIDPDGFTLDWVVVDDARPFGWIAMKSTGTCACRPPQIYRWLKK